MEEKEILKLLRVRKKHLNKKVSEEKLKIRYCRNFSSTKNELNYFVVNNNIATIHFMSRDKSGYLVPHSLELGKRPKGAIFYIKNSRHFCKFRKIQICSSSLKLNKKSQGKIFYATKDSIKKIKKTIESQIRPKLGKPAGWDKINKNKDYEVYFHRGHIIAYSLGGDKEIQGYKYKALKSLFTQTAWSNMGKANKKKEVENKFSQWYFEKIIKDTVVTDSVCMASRPIYRNKADIIPIGVHLQAVTKERSLFNVFLPNIDPNIVIDYKKCTFKQTK